MLFPTAYFPSISYLKAMCVSNNVVLIDRHEHWIKQSIRNRCEILGSSGLHKLVVPICHKNGKQTLGSITVDDATKWRWNHWKSIKTAYGRSPYFEHYAFEIEACIFHDCERLIELNRQILTLFIHVWELPILTSESEEFIPYNDGDFRQKNWLTRHATHTSYQQVFQPRVATIYNASALDLLCCEGPLGRNIILS